MSAPSTASGRRAGPLSGITIVELEGLGPGPFAGMMLADHGAHVIQIERLGSRRPSPDILSRSRMRLSVDLKSEAGHGLVRDLCRNADGFIEGFRPGTVERLGLGPDVLMADNPRLVYGRMTGWGQAGPLAQAAGHDINYIALSGALNMVGDADRPPMVPVNLVGDFGGGGMLLAFGMLAAILNARSGGQGQIVDCAMVDGSALLTTLMWSMKEQGRWRDERGANLFDGAAPFYRAYETADGKAIALGAYEPQFFALLLDRLGLTDDPLFSDQMDREKWPAQRTALAALFQTRSREAWCQLLESSDACATGVLSMTEALSHPHNRARGTFVTVDDVPQPAPAPRYSGTPLGTPQLQSDADGLSVLMAAIGYPPARLGELARAGVVETRAPSPLREAHS
ncbi:Alpha-methylacyl-CoA racemase [Sphingobium chlorophenolicum L-1]|uniref:Alpha-methylacyl-CoA racemase n=1 Tax=Sphingobium chlorophenolicum L-1 TaxID=690566 RepID=F6F340_SPHCR|nr:CaiB/BaiF CoA-transferase family protein [Sphingobium chlorophenolicum]AEG50852.1 Alpha-methylacyl-CoA racemase [Sphingobium chlorophenolicum L-1]